jgi:drug/metabolite transporter (DMT)-like permease
MSLSPRMALLLTVPPAMWASNAIVGRMMVGQVPPLTLNFMRWTLAAILLLPLGWRVLRRLDLVRERLGYLTLVSLLGVGLYNAMQYLALVSTTPINVTLVASSGPLWMLLVGLLFFGDRPMHRQWLGAALSLAGVLVVLGRGSWHTLLQVQFVAGDVYILVAIVGWAFYSWLLVRPPATMRGDQRPTEEQGWDWAGMLLLQALIGSMGAGLLAAGEQWAGAPPIAWSGQVMAALLFVSLGASILAYRSWGIGVAQAGPAAAAMFANLTPLFAALLSAWLLGDPPHGYHVLAFALIAAGIAVNAPRRDSD